MSEHKHYWDHPPGPPEYDDHEHDRVNERTWLWECHGCGQVKVVDWDGEDHYYRFDRDHRIWRDSAPTGYAVKQYPSADDDENNGYRRWFLCTLIPDHAPIEAAKQAGNRGYFDPRYLLYAIIGRIERDIEREWKQRARAEDARR